MAISWVNGSLSAGMEHVYALDKFKEAFKQSLKSKRSGQVLFKFAEAIAQAA